MDFKKFKTEGLPDSKNGSVAGGSKSGSVAGSPNDSCSTTGMVSGSEELSASLAESAASVSILLNNRRPVPGLSRPFRKAKLPKQMIAAAEAFCLGEGVLTLQEIVTNSQVTTNLLSHLGQAGPTSSVDVNASADAVAAEGAPTAPFVGLTEEETIRLRNNLTECAKPIPSEGA